MRLLLDEDVPEPLVPIIKRVLRDRHEVVTIGELQWKSKKDVPFMPALAGADSSQY
jgi:hypothetical protein